MAEKGKIAPPTAGRETFPDSPKRLVSITKQNSATTYNIYGSPQFNPQESRLKNTPHVPSTSEWNKLCFLGCQVWEEGVSAF